VASKIEDKAQQPHGIGALLRYARSVGFAPEDRWKVMVVSLHGQFGQGIYVSR
jgi:hypothetical protein